MKTYKKINKVSELKNAVLNGIEITEIHKDEYNNIQKFVLRDCLGKILRVEAGPYTDTLTLYTEE